MGETTNHTRTVFLSKFTLCAADDEHECFTFVLTAIIVMMDEANYVVVG